jgi:hypothetical protein
MTEWNRLGELAERCEAATGPDRVLDAEIYMAVHGYTLHEDTDPATGHFAFWEGEPWKSPCVNCSSWGEPTASLDAAMVLVPEGWFFHVSRFSESEGPLRGNAHVYGNRGLGDD